MEIGDKLWRAGPLARKQTLLEHANSVFKCQLHCWVVTLSFSLGVWCEMKQTPDFWKPLNLVLVINLSYQQGLGCSKLVYH